MFKITTAIATIILISTTILMFIRITNITKNSLQEYETLLKESTPQDSNPDRQFQQERGKTCKDYWYKKNKERLNAKIFSEKSELTVSFKGKTTEIIEDMQAITCIIQEECYYLLPDGSEAVVDKNGTIIKKNTADGDKPLKFKKGSSLIEPIQKIRLIKSPKGSYNYNTKVFSAEDANFSIFTSTGHDINSIIFPEKPSLSGIAKTMSFYFEEKEPIFKAKHIKAQFHSDDNLK